MHFYKAIALATFALRGSFGKGSSVVDDSSKDDEMKLRRDAGSVVAESNAVERDRNGFNLRGEGAKTKEGSGRGLWETCDLKDCTNPCTEYNMGNKDYHHALCYDPRKYVQCLDDGMGGCAIHSCDHGLVWDDEKKACNYKSPVHPTEVPPPDGGCDRDHPCEYGKCCSMYGYCGKTEKHCDEDEGCVAGCWPPHKTTTTPPHPVCDVGDCDNPCTEEYIKYGWLYHPHCTDPKKYIKCYDDGGCSVKTCDYGWVWDPEEYECVEEHDKKCNADNAHYYCKENECCSGYGYCGVTSDHCDPETCLWNCKSHPVCDVGDCDNPCTEKNIEHGWLHHPLCSNPHKYIQCYDDGGCSVESCPYGWVWDPEDCVCVRAHHHKCDCEENECCSKWGHCGKTEEYCMGDNCDWNCWDKY